VVLCEWRPRLAAGEDPEPMGASLFVGSGAGIAAAGPSVLVSYVVAGFLIILIMRMAVASAAITMISCTHHSQPTAKPAAGLTARPA
jgi:L-asparagine transporter-like permease